MMSNLELRFENQEITSSSSGLIKDNPRYCLPIELCFQSVLMTLILQKLWAFGNVWILTQCWYHWMTPGPRFNIKMSSYQYRKSHCGDKMAVRSSYLHNGISYTVRHHLYIESGPRVSKYILKCCLQNVSHFVQASKCEARSWFRDHFVHAPKPIRDDVTVSHWLGAYTKWSLLISVLSYRPDIYVIHV